MSITREKVSVTFLDQESAETVGWPLHYAATQFGVWQGKTEEELYPLFDRWLDRNTYDLCAVWEDGKKTYRIFRRGFTISNQIDTAMAVTASYCHTEVDFRKVLEHVKFRQIGSSESDIWRTFCYNMRKNWLPTDEDHKYWEEFLSKDKTEESLCMPVLPSSQSGAFKSGFDADCI